MPFIKIFETILYQPLFNLLILIYEFVPGKDFGVAVILLTILTKLLFYPLGAQSIKAQRAFAKLEPKIKELQEKHKNNKEQQTKALMELYQKEKINPLSGCLPLIIQLPILIALYQVFWKGLDPSQMTYLYSFVPPPGVIKTMFLGLFDLKQPMIILALLAGITQFIQTKLAVPKNQIKKGKPTDFSQVFQKQMLYLFPVFTVVILFKLPSAIGLYWTVNNIFSIIQQYFIFKKNNA